MHLEIRYHNLKLNMQWNVFSAWFISWLSTAQMWTWWTVVAKTGLLSVFKSSYYICISRLSTRPHQQCITMTDHSLPSSLMLACFSGHLDIVRYLRKFGASWKSRDMGGCTPLHHAIDGGNVELIDYMIRDGCEVGLSWLWQWICSEKLLVQITVCLHAPLK